MLLAISMLLIMTFAVVHKLSGEALKDLLSLIDMHCLVSHGLIQSLYKFKKYFGMIKGGGHAKIISIFFISIDSLSDILYDVYVCFLKKL